ncbi:arginyl-tRNA synthetase [Rhizobium sp. PP-F2F-G38]|uniref:arginine--tRNA ligase n=1 Tax=Rhizobium sp. PP-CC-3G-465 TaxID=2135648 RepID=UPI000D83137B|nr:arginyl-tRNA synthetase [Rhizobium sp. PP-WC-1G-195]PYE93237.1 arginyl-tRNA synthetase [Rhizobium sp. PP-F2F-G38]TCP75058.1 arginyl-tRNA synthetase [Rhizobium sp. PP-CC-2G-626]TCQ13513.1 arginyl-tRNA synthetase [Rhizobium sp. PP-CC-3G-465]
MSVKSAALAALAFAYEMNGLKAAPSVVRSTRPEFGDLQCNDMMRLAKSAGRNARVLAAEVVEAIPSTFFGDVSVAGPGFVNFRLTDAAIAMEASAMLADPSLAAEKVELMRTVIDFGGPNVAKALHVGHLRSFVIGESLRRILLEIGHDVLSDIHLGDWGLQMGKLLLGAALASGWEAGDPSSFINPQVFDAMTVEELGALYKSGNAACEDEASLALARKLTTKLQDGDPLLADAWSRMRVISLASIFITAEMLGAHFDLFKGESDAHAEVAPMLNDLITRGLARESDGALVIDVSGDGLPDNVPPLLLQKNDGASLYGTTDLATLRQRVRDIGAQQIVYCTDDRQALHIASVFSAARTAGYADDVELRHVTFGTVRGNDNKPFKTRDGFAASLADMIDLALAKSSEKVADCQAATVVGLGALKFADLSTPRKTGYVFDIDRMTSFEGRTGPYLQYAYARICSILDKAAEAGIVPGETVSVSHPSERAVLVECLWYPHALSEAARQLESFEIADQAYRVADAFSRFYTDCPVLKAADPAARLATCKLVARVIGKCLDLLGMATVQRM